MQATPQRILVTGGAGYIGSQLVPRLLSDGHEVTVFDRMIFGTAPLAAVKDHPKLTLAAGDLRDEARMRDLFRSLRFDTVIHLAAISNDPSSDLDPEVTQSVNYDALVALIHLAKSAGVARFLYASSASVYGIKDDHDVTEELACDPITVYARCKAEGEKVLNGVVDDSFVGVSVRSATVCGYAPRLRLDLTINILSDHAMRAGRIRVFGGSQLRPNVHVLDLVDFYVLLLDAPAAKINGQAFNVCRDNASVLGLAEMIRDEIDPKLPIDIEPTNDLRSYHLSAERAKRVLGYEAKRSLVEAVRGLREAYANGLVPNPDDPIHRNVAWMKAHPETWR